MRLSERANRVVSLVAFPALLVALGCVAFAFRNELSGFWRSAEAIRSWVDSTGALAPLAFMGMQALQVIVFVIPGEVIQLAGGFAFGFWGGTLWSVLGILAGSLVNFYVGRILGRRFALAALGAERFERVEAATAGGRVASGFFLLYVVPGVPKDALTYAAGASRLSFGAFLLISTIGRLPGILGSSYMGSAVYEKEYAVAVVLALGAGLLLLLGFLFRERLHGLAERLIGRLSRKGP